MIRSVRGNGTKLGFIFTAADEFLKANDADIKDIVVIPKALSAGVKKHFLLADNDGNPIALGKVSRIADELERASLLFPPFFVYVLLENPQAFEEKLEEWRIGFGSCLWSAFSKWVIK